MIKVFVTLSVICFVNVSSSSVNYCGSKMCGNTNAHTFCQYAPGSSSDCIGYIEAPLTEDEKIRIVNRLNQRRSQAARGLVQKLPTAANMLKLRWVEELAREAQLWADQCRPVKVPEEKDMCRDFYAVTVGQNVASIVGEAPGLKPESLADMWHMQSLHYKANLTYLQPRNDIRYYGDFGQMIWAKTYMVGCGRSRFMSPHNGRLRSIERLVCNLAPRGPGEGHPLWTPGLPASMCPRHTQPDTEFPGLCAHLSGLNYDNDTSLTTDDIQDDILLHTILEVEKNKTLNYVGSIDEFYLTRMAVASLLTNNDNPLFNTINQRDTAKIVVGEKDLNYNEEKYANNGITIERTKKKNKKNKSLVGRPKPYDIDYLNEVDGEPDRKNQHLMRRRQNEDRDVEDDEDDDDDEDFDNNEKFAENYEASINKRSVNNPKPIIHLNFTDNTEVPVVLSNTNHYANAIIDANVLQAIVQTLPMPLDDPGAFILSVTPQFPIFYPTKVFDYQSKQNTTNEIDSQSFLNQSAPAVFKNILWTENPGNGIVGRQSYFPENSVNSYTELLYDTYPTETTVNTINVTTQDTYAKEMVVTTVPYAETIKNLFAINNTAVNTSAILPSTKTEEEYLSDSETVEQLQEALDRIEREMAGNPVKTNFSSKVRRDLSEKMANNPQIREYYQSVKGYGYNDTGKYEPKNIRSFPLNNNNVLLQKKDEKGPIINMVMKYLPSYLGQYKQQLRDITNDSDSLLPSMIHTIILLIVCL